MAGSHVLLPASGAITILSGAAVSNIILSKNVYEDADEILIAAPAALDALTFTFEVSMDRDAIAGSTWVTLQSGDQIATAADLAPPAAGKARRYQDLARFPAFRIKASGNVAADRIFTASKRYGL